MAEISTAAPPLPAVRRGRALATTGILVGLALGALDATVVGPAMPKIVHELGGIELYFLVTAAFMVTSTSTTPVWGRLLDIFGRRPFHLVGVLVFVAGSALCGSAHTMTQLVLYRGLQGLGFGALMPVSFTMVADLYPLEERGKMQGLVAAVWGLSSIIGPLLGSFITEHFGWPWVFYVNLPIGVASMVLVQAVWKEPALPKRHRKVDLAGALLTLFAAGSFLAGCALFNQGHRALTIASFAAAGLGVLLLVVCERRAADPFIVHELFRIRLFSTGVACGAFGVVCLFCTTTYITLYMQDALGYSIKASAFVLLPMTFGWVICSGIGSPLSLRVGYRPLALLGMALATAAYAMLTPLGTDGTWLKVAVPMTLLGSGLGIVLTPLLIGAQNAVPKDKLGAATSLTQFSRTMVGAIGVAVMGVLLTQALSGHVPAGLTPNELLNPARHTQTAPEVVASMRDAIAAGCRHVFLVGLVAAIAGLVCAFLLPGGSGRSLANSKSVA